MNTLERVLVVDDDADIQMVARMSLETLGNLQVESSDDGLDALEKLQTWQADLILMDVMMPRLDGPGALKKLKLDPKLKHIPVVIMTARSEAGQEGYYEALGAAGVIPKPFDPMSLMEQITRIYANSGGENEAR